MTTASTQDGDRGRALPAPRLSLRPGLGQAGAQARSPDQWAGAGQLSGGCEWGLPGPVFTVTTRPGSLHFLNRQAPSGWRLARPLIAPPLGLAAPVANGDRDGYGKAGWGWSIPALRRASGLAVGCRGPRGGRKRGCTHSPSGPMEGRPGTRGGRAEGGAEP